MNMPTNIMTDETAVVFVPEKETLMTLTNPYRNLPPIGVANIYQPNPFWKGIPKKKKKKL